MTKRDIAIMDEYMAKVAKAKACQLANNKDLLCSCPPVPELSQLPRGQEEDMDGPAFDGSFPWANFPLGRSYLKGLIAHFALQKDVQVHLLLLLLH
jgi:hypothetical protein